MKTIYVKKEYHDKLHLSEFGNAGPNPCISGMKQIWGKNSYCVMCGVYLYRVDEQTYYEALALSRG